MVLDGVDGVVVVGKVVMLAGGGGVISHTPNLTIAELSSLRLNKNTPISAPANLYLVTRHCHYR